MSLLSPVRSARITKRELFSTLSTDKSTHRYGFMANVNTNAEVPKFSLLLRMKLYEPFPPDLCSNFELRGCGIHNANAETCPSYNHSLAFSLLSSPAFNNLLKGVF